MKSLFDLFDEAKSIYRNDKLKVNPQSANYHFGLTKDKVASERIRKEILGWEVWFLNEMDSPDFKGWVEGQEREVYDVLSALQQLGVRKTMRHPIFIHFGKGSGPSKLADDNAGGLAVSKTAVRGHGINIKDTPGVHIYANLNKDIKETLVHEITHIIYSTLSFEQQENIRMLANSSYSPSFYGMPGTVFKNQKNPHVHHSSGNEWFAEMVALIFFGVRLKNKTGLTYQKMDRTKFQKLRMFLQKIFSDNEFKWITLRCPNCKNNVNTLPTTKDRVEECPNCGDKFPVKGSVIQDGSVDIGLVRNDKDVRNLWGDLSGISSSLGNNLSPQPNIDTYKDYPFEKDVKIPKRLRNKFPTDFSGRLDNLDYSLRKVQL